MLLFSIAFKKTGKMNRTVIWGHRPIMNRLSQRCQQWSVKILFTHFKICSSLLYSKTRHKKISLEDKGRHSMKKFYTKELYKLSIGLILLLMLLFAFLLNTGVQAEEQNLPPNKSNNQCFWYTWWKLSQPGYRVRNQPGAAEPAFQPARQGRRQQKWTAAWDTCHLDSPAPIW